MKTTDEVQTLCDVQTVCRVKTVCWAQIVNEILLCVAFGQWMKGLDYVWVQTVDKRWSEGYVWGLVCW